MNLCKNFLVATMALVGSQLFSQTQGIVSQNGLLKVNGNKIENESGEVFKVAGNSIFWSGFGSGSKFYTAQNAPIVVEELVNNWDSGIVRAAMAVEEADGTSYNVRQSGFLDNIQPEPNAQGYFNNPAREMERIENMIDAAIANDIYVIVDFHSHFADAFETEAITFFTDIATKYGNNDHIIYEIFNEPISTERHRNQAENNVFGSRQLQDQTWNNIIRPYAINVINTIRAIDPDNLIVVGTPGFSQFVNVAADNPITANDLNLPNGAELNLAYTLHFYADTHDTFLRGLAQEALDKGIALVVTEWGTPAASGDGNVNVAETIRWMDFMNNNDLSHANWSIVDQDESSAVILPNQGVNGLLQGRLTESGIFTQCLIQNFNAGTSYASCNTTGVPNEEEEQTGATETCSDGGGVVPNGVGIKVEVETPAGIGATDFCGNRSDFRSAGLAVGTVPAQGAGTTAQGILTGFGGGTSAVFSALPILEQGSYTVQLVYSSNSFGNSLNLQRDSGMVSLGSVALPNTGGLDNYQIVTISGVPFAPTNAGRDIAINVTGPGPVNVESFYYALDSTPALDVEDFEAFSQASISLYPVPSQSTLNVSIPDVGNSSVEYSINNLRGQLIQSQTKLIDNKIDIQGLQSGVYILSLNIGGSSRIFRFVKN